MGTTTTGTATTPGAATTRTRLVKLSPLSVRAAQEAGLAVATSRTSVTLAGDPDAALAAVRAAQAEGLGGKALTTLVRKLTDRKPIYVLVLTVGTDATQEENTMPDTTPANAPVTTDEEAEAVMVANADAEEAAEEAKPKRARRGRKPAAEADATEVKAERAEAEPKRAPLREGYTTPVGLTNVINEKGLYRGNRADGLLTSQAMYTYIKSNGEGSAHPFPLEVIDGRQVVNIEAGLAWWTAKEERVAAKAAAAKAKAEAVAAKRAQRAAAKAETGTEDPAGKTIEHYRQA